MSEGGGFSIVQDSISQKLAISGAAITAYVSATLLDEAQFALDYAKATAPWENRTGAARAGLDVDVYMEGLTVNLALFHTVDYGLWLEVIQSGAYAVIMPTLESLAPLIFKSVNAEYSDTIGGSGW